MEQKNTMKWVVVGAVILIALALGYYFYAPDYRSPAGDQAEESGDLSDMSAGVGAVSLEGLDSELADIDAELK